MAETTDEINIVNLQLNKLNFKKVKDKSEIKNYIMSDKNDNTKPKIMLEKVNIPFGVEKYNGNNILNIEIDPKKNNIHYNYHAVISGFENELAKIENFKDKKLTSDITGKGYYPNIRDSKEGYILRSYIFTVPEVYSMVSGRDKTIKNIKNKMSLLDVEKVKANVELELGSLWINDNNYGFIWYIKKIEVLYSL